VINLVNKTLGFLLDNYFDSSYQQRQSKKIINCVGHQVSKNQASKVNHIELRIKVK